MQLLKDTILKEGFCLPGNILKVDSFVNHQIDPELTYAIGHEFAQRFADEKIDKVVTIESSGIAMALPAAHELEVKLVFARKNKSVLMKEEAIPVMFFLLPRRKASRCIFSRNS